MRKYRRASNQAERKPVEKTRYLPLESKYAASMSNPGFGATTESLEGYPDGVEFLPRIAFREPATTLYARDAPEDLEDLYNRLWKHQHGRLATPRFKISSEVEKGLMVDSTEEEKYLRIRPLLDLVPQCRRYAVIRRFQRANLRRFSAHYGGNEGAFIGAAIIEMYDDLESFLNAESDLHDRAREYWDVYQPERDENDERKKYIPELEDLAEFAFEVWGDEE
ncbi:hypothetical protein NDI76_11570 [Halogeometricum sp. S1BR25-6]|uniref:Uncharacterized protein n=1 Tax=Halogeometricum salsisoli TaxID=2950536 RepID=A0ABU2GEZ7_9EURY|nr:hypothetical protein [Halogeometricum sp. S1BR25-6]MDS0299381.1 hypothetical protein [Halogeometricum sp. S1BR25-6]